MPIYDIIISIKNFSPCCQGIYSGKDDSVSAEYYMGAMKLVTNTGDLKSRSEFHYVIQLSALMAEGALYSKAKYFSNA